MGRTGLRAGRLPLGWILPRADDPPATPAGSCGPADPRGAPWGRGGRAPSPNLLVDRASVRLDNDCNNWLRISVAMKRPPGSHPYETSTGPDRRHGGHASGRRRRPHHLAHRQRLPGRVLPRAEPAEVRPGRGVRHRRGAQGGTAARQRTRSPADGADSRVRAARPVAGRGSHPDRAGEGHPHRRRRLGALRRAERRGSQAPVAAQAAAAGAAPGSPRPAGPVRGAVAPTGPVRQPADRQASRTCAACACTPTTPPPSASRN